MISLTEAVEVFAVAFARQKSLTWPCEITRDDQLWLMQDRERKKPRKAEILAISKSIAEIERFRSETGSGWHFLCDIWPTGTDLTERTNEVKAAGYRKLSTEWIFTHDLREIQPVEKASHDVAPATQLEYEKIHQLSPQWRKWNPEARQYAWLEDEKMVGYVSAHPVQDHEFVMDLHVREDFRRQGIASALMTRLLQDDQKLAVNTSVLVASAAGATLYPRLGYVERATLTIYCPKDR